MSTKQPDKDSEEKGGGEKDMVRRAIFVDRSMWNTARRKAVGKASLSEVVRRLLRLWIDGKINLDEYED